MLISKMSLEERIEKTKKLSIPAKCDYDEKFRDLNIEFEKAFKNYDHIKAADIDLKTAFTKYPGIYGGQCNDNN